MTCPHTRALQCSAYYIMLQWCRGSSLRCIRPNVPTPVYTEHQHVLSQYIIVMLHRARIAHGSCIGVLKYVNQILKTIKQILFTWSTFQRLKKGTVAAIGIICTLYTIRIMWYLWHYEAASSWNGCNLSVTFSAPPVYVRASL